MPQPLLHIIEDYAQQTDNKCGLTIVNLMHRAGLSYPEVKDQLNELFQEGKIKIRKGIHGKLIFKPEI